MTLELHDFVQALGHFKADLSREESPKQTSLRPGLLIDAPEAIGSVRALEASPFVRGVRAIATFNSKFALHRDTPLLALLTKR